MRRKDLCQTIKVPAGEVVDTIKEPSKEKKAEPEKKKQTKRLDALEQEKYIKLIYQIQEYLTYLFDGLDINDDNL